MSSFSAAPSAAGGLPPVESLREIRGGHPEHPRWTTGNILVTDSSIPDIQTVFTLNTTNPDLVRALAALDSEEAPERANKIRLFLESPAPLQQKPPSDSEATIAPDPSQETLSVGQVLTRIALIPAPDDLSKMGFISELARLILAGKLNEPHLRETNRHTLLARLYPQQSETVPMTTAPQGLFLPRSNSLPDNMGKAGSVKTGTGIFTISPSTLTPSPEGHSPHRAPSGSNVVDMMPPITEEPVPALTHKKESVEEETPPLSTTSRTTSPPKPPQEDVE